MLIHFMLGTLVVAVLCFMVGRISVRPGIVGTRQTERVEMQERA